MSVLLEALKKAAEEKQKRLKFPQSPEPQVDELPTGQQTLPTQPNLLDKSDEPPLTSPAEESQPFVLKLRNSVDAPSDFSNAPLAGESIDSNTESSSESNSQADATSLAASPFKIKLNLDASTGLVVETPGVASGDDRQEIEKPVVAQDAMVSAKKDEANPEREALKLQQGTPDSEAFGQSISTLAKSTLEAETDVQVDAKPETELEPEPEPITKNTVKPSVKPSVDKQPIDKQPIDKQPVEMVFKMSALEPAVVVSDLDTALEMASVPPSTSPSSVKASAPRPVEMQQAKHKPSVMAAILEEQTHISQAVSPTEMLAKSTRPGDEDWGLDQIPAYQAAGIAKQARKANQSKMQKILQVLKFSPSSGKQKSNGSQLVGPKPFFSKNIMIGLLSVLSILAVGYFGMSYYVVQQSQVDKNLRQFDLPLSSRMPLVAKPETKAETDNAETNVAGQTEAEASQTNATPLAPPIVSSSTPKASQTKPTEGNAGAPLPIGQAQIANNAAVALPQGQAKAVKNPLVAPARVNRTPTKPKPVNIQVSSQPAVSHELLAFEAFEKGDYTLAKRHYQLALNANAKNIPALYGMGALAMQQGETRAAIQYYQRIVQLDPLQTRAESAIMALKSKELASQSFAELSDWLQNNPNDDLASFVLANQYAQKQDWLNAQKYFFNAFALAPNNAEYALNLAVSYDHLGEYALAKRYYEQALAVGDDKTAQSVKARILSIDQFLRK